MADRINRHLLDLARRIVVGEKTAFVAQGPADPAMAGAMPMDPSMADAVPVDPSMLAGGPVAPAAPPDPTMVPGAAPAPPLSEERIRAILREEMQAMGARPPKQNPADALAEVKTMLQRLLSALGLDSGIPAAPAAAAPAESASKVGTAFGHAEQVAATQNQAAAMLLRRLAAQKGQAA